MTSIEISVPVLAACPSTHALLATGHLVVHDAVERVTLHGSRGPGGRPRPDSDIDLALGISDAELRRAPDAAALLRAVLSTTLDAWRGAVEVDLAAVFDREGCGLGCLIDPDFDFTTCPTTHGCLGVFKVQRGFDGYVAGEGVDCRRMQPSLVVWTREAR